MKPRRPVTSSTASDRVAEGMLRSLSRTSLGGVGRLWESKNQQAAEACNYRRCHPTALSPKASNWGPFMISSHNDFLPISGVSSSVDPTGGFVRAVSVPPCVEQKARKTEYFGIETKATPEFQISGAPRSAGPIRERNF